MKKSEDIKIKIEKKINKIKIKEKKIKKKINKIKKKKKEIHLREQAKIENIKKKINENKKIICNKNLKFFIIKLIPIIDYIEDSIKFLKKINKTNKNTKKGLSLIFKSILNTIKKFNVKIINKKKNKFKNYIKTIKNKNKKNNKISIIKKGYILQKKILRKAIIKK
ncbi:nucleotide exchange factor GrpE [Buchnera aphidicola]|uniref:nucleotide exchange factor GrpE n=1 Tax=Buchnera aphidicola TaxID=9 RepID=UPI0031B8A1B0